MKLIHVLLFFGCIFLISCSADDCKNYLEGPCQSHEATGPRSYSGRVEEKVNDSTYIPVPECIVVDSAWQFNNQQCGSTQCPFYKSTSTDNQGYFHFTERPDYVKEVFLIVRKDGFEPYQVLDPEDSIRVVLVRK